MNRIIPSLSRRRFLLGATAMGLHPFTLHAASDQVHLRLIETTDVHVHLLAYDYYADQPVDTVGLARTASLIEQVRAEAGGGEGTLLLDAGDFLQGSPLGDYAVRAAPRDAPHPVMAAMNALGYDAAAIGNHEFNYGLDFLTHALAGARFPVLCANVLRGTIPAAPPLFTPYILLDRHLRDGAGQTHILRVGVIGFVPPQIMRWDHHHLTGKVMAIDILAAAERYLPEMRERGADLIIALAHTGIGSARAHAGMENAAVPLARMPLIDGALLGHSHRVFPGPDYRGFRAVDIDAGTVSGTPAVMAGFWGSHMGLIDLLLGRDGGRWRILASESVARPIATAQRPSRALVPSAPSVRRAVHKAHTGALAYLRRPVGTSQAPLHSYFALVAPSTAVALINQAQAWSVRTHLAGTAWQDWPVLSAAAPFRVGYGGPENYTDIPAGAITMRNLADLYRYPNTVQALDINGAVLRAWLERSASMFARLIPRETEQTLIDPRFRAYNFDVISGVRYQIDLSKPARYHPRGGLVNKTARRDTAHRIVDLRFADRPVTNEDRFVLATNSFRASGGGRFPVGDHRVILRTPETNRRAIERYVQAHQGIMATHHDTWSLRAMPGTSAVFTTGPGAARYAARSGLALTELGLNRAGYLRYRLDL
ncbi:MAG: bifunctional 2',3'-cyclic-nucleotide 2'-phosphodiesterase/3'-nucleotidase [Pseudomonadota bacterium]